MRAPIWVQLALLVGTVALVALVVVAVPTWIYVQGFVSSVESDGLALAASLYAAKIDTQLKLLNTIGRTVSTRVLIQESLSNYYAGNVTKSTVFEPTVTDLESALSTSSLTGLLQARIYSRNQTGEDSKGLVSVTGTGVGNLMRDIPLPYNTPNGTRASLGDGESGYPPSLYPNITYRDLGHPNPYVPSVPAVSASAFPGVLLSDSRGLLLGPLMVNESFALISLTIPIRSIKLSGFILGYMTLVAAANSFLDIQTARDGLGTTGVAFLITPDDPSNRFTPPEFPSNKTSIPPQGSLANARVRFVLPPLPQPGQFDRHDGKNGGWNSSFTLSQYPAILDSYMTYSTQLNNAKGQLSATNEQGASVAVAVARPQTTLVDWAVVVEKSHGEAYKPINKLRTILLACAFGTAGLVILISIPCAQLSVRPIRRLKLATEQSMHVPGYDFTYSEEKPAPSSGGTFSSASIKGLFKSIQRRFGKPQKPMTQAEIDNHRRAFRIPARVKETKHIITDEVTELTAVYNRMTDELVKQYTSLDEKVAKRTHELELSKKAAEAANESKTLFIANISHELKTPLNGIMGICAVCMEENDILHIQHSLKTLYRSGELLLHLLDDLLSFSKNQISHEIKLTCKEFRLGELKSQIVSIFDKQARDSKIDLQVSFQHSRILEQNSNTIMLQYPEMRQPDSIRLRDMYVVGDQHRILQVIINLLSNSLKFTPEDGKVQVRIVWGDEIPESTNGTQVSVDGGHDSNNSILDTAVSNDESQALTLHPSHNTSSPLEDAAKTYMFTFEVEDTGRGIPEAMIDKIFEPFVQVDSSFSKEFGGTGLGLSICSQLAKLMHGTISVQSTPGLGSTFSLKIPLKHVPDRVPSTRSESTRPMSRAISIGGSTNAGAGGSSRRNSLNSVMVQEPEVAPHAANIDSHRTDLQPRLVGLSTPFFPPNPNQVATQSANSTTIISPTSNDEKQVAIQKAKADKANSSNADDETNNLRVLVADDNATNIEVVRRMLKLEKVNDVTIARDGQQAYNLVKDNMDQDRKFDLIFMDVQMPNLDGIQSTRLIRKAGYAAPIVALTAFSEESNRKECMESGMNEFLAKPIRRQALKSMLTKFATIYE